MKMAHKMIAAFGLNSPFALAREPYGEAMRNRRFRAVPLPSRISSPSFLALGSFEHPLLQQDDGRVLEQKAPTNCRDDFGMNPTATGPQSSR
jgi:hypothetical protein